jgi:hypothetical protein
MQIDTLSQRYALRSDNVILLHRHNVLLWTPQHVNTTIDTKSSQRNITTLVLASSAVDRGFEPQSGHTKVYAN